MDAKKLRNTIILGVILNAIAITLTALLIGYVKTYIFSLVFAAIAVFIVLFAVGLKFKIEWLYKFVITCYYIGIVVLAIFLAVVRSGLITQFYDENGELSATLIADVISQKKSAAILFIALSFLQVTFLPIPSTVMTLVGAAVFGVWKGALFSMIGQVAGSMTAFWLGKVFGKRIIVWMVGQDAFDKYNSIIKGRDKIVIVFMLLFPFFPDDLLCMFAGLTTFKGITFLIIIILSRFITITETSLGFSALDKIRALGGWSYVIYIAFALIIIAFFILVWKKGDVIEEKILQLFDKLTPKRFKKATVTAPTDTDTTNDTVQTNADITVEQSTTATETADELPTAIEVVKKETTDNDDDTKKEDKSE